ncbi:MAG: hypothetical protein PHG14_11230 [Desulfobacter postgatei]|uniref:hypothetical protein n=1 Tax=Desulfobacter postgatei TaxID=2293 RepID=UPI0023F0AF46|nr:hypothetical protein [Desulfobacter postgatei]MDD4274286.1 hypothetical protein [Desulfobacter postgatei]
MKKEETQVTKWLKANNAEAYVDEFFSNGFYYVEDIDDEDLKEIIKEPGTRRMLARLVKEKKERPVPPIPTLPAETQLDLSARELKSPDGISFNLPTAVQVSPDGKKVVAPSELKQEEWMVVARNSCLLYGRRMDGREPAVAQFPVLVWRVPGEDRFVRSEHLAAEVKTEVTYTETASNYVSQGFTKVTATASFPFCSASFAREHTEKHAASCKNKQMFMTGIWHYPRARILLQECSAVSPSFVRDIRNAVGLAGTGELSEQDLGELRGKLGLEVTEPTDAQQQNARQAVNRVARVLLEYGHVVGWNVELGGRLFFLHHRSDDGKSSYQEYKDTTSAAVGIKTAFARGEAGASQGSGKGSEDEAHQIAETAAFTALGGDTTFASNPNAWAATIKDPNLWAVVSIDEAKNTISLLPDLLRDAIENLWRLYGRGGPLDGYLVELEARIPGKRLLSLDPTNHQPIVVETYKQYEPLPGTLWNIVGRRDDSYCLQHKKSGYLLGVVETALTSFPPETLKRTDCYQAMWRIFPVDPSAIHGGEFSDCYFVQHVVTEMLLANNLKLISGSVLDADPKAETSRVLMWDLDPLEGEHYA